MKNHQFIVPLLLTSMLAACSSEPGTTTTTTTTTTTPPPTTGVTPTTTTPTTTRPPATVVTTAPTNVTPTVLRPTTGTMSSSGGGTITSSSGGVTSTTANTSGATGITIDDIAKPNATTTPTTVADTSSITPSDTKVLEGVWDISSTEVGEQTDFGYLEIREDGQVWILDDQFDEDGGFADCLIEDDDSFFLTPLGNDQYTLTEVSLDATTGAVVFDQVNLAIFIENNVLNVISADTDDENGNGATDDFLLEQFPMISFDIDTIPECEDTSSIAGLWDASFTDDATGLVDVIFVEIGTAGEVTVIDDQFDDVDAGENCYVKGQTTFTPAGGDTYDTDEGDTLFIFNDGQQLIVGGNQDDQEFWPPVEGATTSADFNDCV